MKIHYSKKNHGNLCFRYGNKNLVIQNRFNFFKEINVDPKTTIVMQVDHKDDVAIVNSNDVGKGVHEITSAIKVDALITNQKDFNLMLLTADCLPVTIYDSKNQVIALVHLGWKSITLNLYKKVLNELKNKFNSKYLDLEFHIGPSIDAKSYIQSSPIQLKDLKWKPFIKKVSNGYQVDLKGFLKVEITKLSPGIKIFDTMIDTATSSEYFSHYRSKYQNLSEKRFATVVHL